MLDKVLAIISITAPIVSMAAYDFYIELGGSG